MAAAAKDLRYSRSVDGSLARELDWAVRERELRHAGEAPRHETRSKERVRSKARAHVEVREKQRVAIPSVLGVAAVLGMALLVLLSYVQLTVLSADTVALKAELAALETEHVTLTAEYERMFDLATVRQAAEKAGMSKPSISQVCWLDVSDGDSVEIYQEAAGPVDKLKEMLGRGVYTAVEYFN